ncbi:putative N-acetyltransferase YjcF [Actinomadura rubteroloni]|uniref:Putative N-acetyltransferase YjcF n=1 Tax=Actinomadura rubteroloni TaxID=1926885 RepID=A0A2P4UFY5_9ACTN|nr:GNAT family N-acetyltransferase [Actinomadura rubteroloni]POM23973.1 putative N-acetyltransferase YjcF [Actinomadura rubteroloni]
MSAEIVPVVSAADREHAYAVRFAVFVREQGVPPEIELDAADAAADHLLARIDGRPAGTVRLLRRDGTGVLGRLAVLAEARGTGLGAALVRAVEDRARAAGLTAVELHAQVAARGFYERLGYEAFGAEDEEAGIPHIWMRRRIEND